MSQVLHRNLRSRPPMAIAGDGAYVIAEDGTRYLDACGGAAVSNLGHSNARIQSAIREQLEQLPYAHTGFFSTPVLEQLGQELVARAPGMESVLLVSGGSEAVEAALKLARQYFVEKGEAQRRYFIAREQSYHGNTLGGLAVGGNRWRRQDFLPLLIQTQHIPPCYEYRYREAGESLEAYGLRMANKLEERILEVGAENVAAFVAETVVGATAGALVPVPGYFKRIREICDRYGVLLILDEVMCGVGRTGTFFAYEQQGIQPDIVTLAKGLGAGYQPIGAVLCRPDIHNCLRDGSGFFQHGHTFMGHACAAAAALATLQEIDEARLLEKVLERGVTLRKKLEAALGNKHYVGQVRGQGFFIGIELVADKENKTPFSPNSRLHQKVKQLAMRQGLMCYPMGGTVDGLNGDHVLLAPPFILNAQQEDELVDKLGAALDAAVLSLRH